MSRINTNVQSLIAQRVLNQNNNSLNTSLERLSTGLRINRGKDDPAGLIASENLRKEMTATTSAIGNAERADQVVNIAEGGLQEVSGLLTELQGLLTTSANTAGLSDAEKAANQLQVDSILQTIDRIAGATSFQGTKLLNGNFDYQTDNVAASVETYRVNGAKLDGNDLNVDVIVTQSAQQAGLFLSLGGGIDLGGAQGSTFTIEITGALGSRELSFASGTSLADVVNTINTFTEVTGVEAAVGTGSGSGGVTLRSDKYGSDQFVRVQIVSDANFTATNAGSGIFNFEATDTNAIDGATVRAFNSTAASNGVRDAGQDIAATINGVQATARGRTIRVNTDFLDVEMTIAAAQATQRGSIQAFDITAGGADFQLAGQVDIAGKVSLGIQDVSTRKLGRFDTSGEGNFRRLDDLGSGKSLNVVDGDLSNAQNVVASAIEEVSSLRGRLGAFQRNTIGATIRSLNIGLENTNAANSVIRDTDFASETASLTRGQILSAAATNTLSLANSQPQAVLQLLG
ncbi:MAG: flagellin [Phycisphaerales bacterium]|nr:MAG: flagellin [Phycisphaerales bacterium]